MASTREQSKKDRSKPNNNNNNNNTRKQETFKVLVDQADAALLREMSKLINRIERALVPTQSLIHDPVSDRLSALSRRVQQGLVFTDVGLYDRDALLFKAYSKNSESVVRKVDWELFVKELTLAVSGGDADKPLPAEVVEEVEIERDVHEQRLNKALKKEKGRQLQFRNDQPVMPGKWRREPFSRRVYDRIDSYVVTSSIDTQEGEALLQQLDTPLDGYVGQAYNYDDHGLTEEWMLSFRDKHKPSDDDVIHTQLAGLMEIMGAQVQDRICNEAKVLCKPPLLLGKDIQEVPVWGIDCYTRRMVEIAIEDNVDKARRSPLMISAFVEKTLLPAINAQPSELAHNMVESLKYILEKPNVLAREKEYAQCVLSTINTHGIDSFKIHPKGTGVVCMRPEGIPAHVLVADYLGELYPAYRWCEKLDVVEQAQNTFELKPTLPDFYNILLERPRQDPDGYGLLYVDASQRANVGSSCSHSCNSNCTSAVVARNNKLSIVLTTNRMISYGEELTMDYYSITTSDVEWRAAICLCGMSSCRGSFLHYATQDELQLVLSQNCGPLWRYASLLRSCSSLPLTAGDRAVLARHGAAKAMLGAAPPLWACKYASDVLRFVEFERKALPCALMRHGASSYASADMDARCVMEQRVQSLACCLSMVRRVAAQQPRESESSLSRDALPLVALSVGDVVRELFAKVEKVPALLRVHLLTPLCVTCEKKDDDELRGKRSLVESVLERVEKIVRVDAPKGLAKFREICLAVRGELKCIENLRTPSARVAQLADVLVLWACTSNFSVPQRFAETRSRPVTVTARELGTNIARSKVRAPPRDERKRSPRLHCADKTPSASSPRESERETSTTTEESAASVDVTLTNETETETQTQTARETETEIAAEPSCADATNDMNVVDDAEDSHKHAAEPAAKTAREYFLSPNEPVFEGAKVYPPLFTFWQLIGWFNAGTDQKVEAPDLFGCVELPEPSMCFGASEAPYGPRQREQLVEIIRDEKLQNQPWPAALKTTFSAAPRERERALYGSPFLDVALGQVDSVYKVMREMKIKDLKSVAHGGAAAAAVSTAQRILGAANVQLDSILPPETPTSWVQCDACKKWRRVPWHVDMDSLPDAWVCAQNSWDGDAASASCAAPQDDFDPAVENTLEYGGGCTADNGASATVDQSDLGQWRDVFCVKNLVFYEAQIKKMRVPKRAGDKMKVLFHYKGWSAKFDEWIDCDSERVQPHNLHTNPHLKDPRSQEAYQGVAPVKATVRSAFVKTADTVISDDAASVNGASKGKKRKSAVFASDSAAAKSAKREG